MPVTPAIVFNSGGTLYFCSRACREAYRKREAPPPSATDVNTDCGSMRSAVDAVCCAKCDTRLVGLRGLVPIKTEPESPFWRFKCGCIGLPLDIAGKHIDFVKVWLLEACDACGDPPSVGFYRELAADKVEAATRLSSAKLAIELERLSELCYRGQLANKLTAVLAQLNRGS